MTKKHRFIARILIAAIAPMLVVVSVVAQQQSAPLPGVPVHMVVTVEARHGSQVPSLQREDVMVYEGRDRDKVTDWVPVQGSKAGLELFVLIDDAADTTSLGSQLGELSKFINAQPATTAIGVGYMRNGAVAIAQNPNNDHAQAAKALRLPSGDPGASASAYLSVTDLLKRWPATEAPR